MMMHTTLFGMVRNAPWGCFPFPAEGEMSITAHGVDFPLGAFTPSWTPGQPAPSASPAAG
jgi:hypothetical protein